MRHAEFRCDTLTYWCGNPDILVRHPDILVRHPDILVRHFAMRVYTGWVKKVARSFVIHNVHEGHEQWIVRRHDCVISAIKFIMKTFLLELEPVWLVYLLYINLSVNAICIKSFNFATVCDVDNLCVLMSWTGYFLLTYPVYIIMYVYIR